MQRSEIMDQIRKILISVLNHENFEMTESLSATDTDGWDSLTHMMIVSEVEKTYGIAFKLKELNKMRNVGDLIDLVVSKI
jgi:acyl carrier protein